jgi:hypothetical protein
MIWLNLRGFDIDARCMLMPQRLLIGHRGATFLEAILVPHLLFDFFTSSRSRVSVSGFQPDQCVSPKEVAIWLKGSTAQIRIPEEVLRTGGAGTFTKPLPKWQPRPQNTAIVISLVAAWLTFHLRAEINSTSWRKLAIATLQSTRRVLPTNCTSSF